MYGDRTTVASRGHLFVKCCSMPQYLRASRFLQENMFCGKYMQIKLASDIQSLCSSFYKGSKQMFYSKRHIRQRAQFSVLNHTKVISIDAVNVFYLSLLAVYFWNKIMLNLAWQVIEMNTILCLWIDAIFVFRFISSWYLNCFKVGVAVNGKKNRYYIFWF